MALTFEPSLPDYLVGQLINMEEWNTISRVLGGAVNLPFGVPAVSTAATEWDVAPLTAAAQNILGITRMNQVLYHEGDYYAPKDIASIITMGVIGVLLGADVTEGAQARFNTANGTWTGAAASSTVLTVPGAQFEYAGKSGAVGVIRYNRPILSVSVGA